MDLRSIVNEMKGKSPLIDRAEFLIDKEVNRCSIVGQIIYLHHSEVEGCCVLFIRTVDKKTLELNDIVRVILIIEDGDVELKNDDFVGFIDPYIVKNSFNGVKSIVDQRELIIFRARQDQNGSPDGSGKEKKNCCCSSCVIQRVEEVTENRQVLSHNESALSDSEGTSRSKRRRLRPTDGPIKPNMNVGQNSVTPSTSSTEDRGFYVITSEIVNDIKQEDVHDTFVDTHPSTSYESTEQQSSGANGMSSDEVYTITDSPLSPKSNCGEVHGLTITSAFSLSIKPETTDLRVQSNDKALQLLLTKKFVSTMECYLYGMILQNSICRMISDEVAQGFCSNCLSVYNYTQFKCIREENIIGRIPYCPDCPGCKLKVYFFCPLKLENDDKAPVDMYFYSDSRKNFLGIDPEEYSNNNEIRGQYRWDVMKKLGEKKVMISCNFQKVEYGDYVIPMFNGIQAFLPVRSN